MSRTKLLEDNEYPNINEYVNTVKLQYEKEIAGTYLSGHPLDTYLDEIKNFTFNSSFLPDDSDDDYQDESNDFDSIVEDSADLYSVSEETALLSRMQEITQYCNVALVTISENDKVTTRDYAEKKCYNMFGGESSVLFLIDMEYREIYIWSMVNQLGVKSSYYSIIHKKI